MDRSEAGKLGYQTSLPKINEYYRKYRLVYENNPKRCKHCNTPIPYEKKDNKFCNQSCGASFNNKGMDRTKIKVCSCGTEYTGKNRKCESCFGTRVNFEDLKEDSARKKRLLKERPHQCEICNNTQWLGSPILLIFDHIDGNSDNNDKMNLRLICSNCDATLPTYKAKNKGSGRSYRRKTN